MLRYAAVVTLIVTLLDQLTKWFMISLIFGLEFFKPSQVLSFAPSLKVTSFFSLVTVWNPGVSFGLLNSVGPLILSLLTIGVCVMIAFWVHRSQRCLFAIAMGFIMGGAIGNLIDRLHFGKVFDFLDFHLNAWHWPAFNLADSAILIGVVLVFLEAIFASATKKS